ncbi:MAG TPA: polysaccharide lyase [Niastella sp.]
MIPKEQIILSLVLLTGTMFYSLTAPPPKPTSHILYQVDFEENDPFPSFLSTQTSTRYGLQVVNNPVYEGKQAARFELRDSDPENNNGTRAEISFPRPHNTTNLERWYAFALFFPGDDYDFDNSDEVISQWHQGGKATPSLCIRTKANRIRLRITPRPNIKKVIDLGAIEKNVWQYYVIHVKHSAGPDGLVEIWRNEALLANYTGANMYDLSNMLFHTPNWKLGIYKSVWNGAAVTKVHKRVLYVDHIKMGDNQASLSEMAR